MNKKKYTTPEPERWEEMLRAALDLARLGIPVFPVHGVLLGANGPVCTCGATGDGHSVGKHPTSNQFTQRATLRTPTIEKWWSPSMWPGANIGVPTGRKSGWLVLDCDPRHGSDDSLEQLECDYEPLPATLTVATPSGGEHRIFRYPLGFDIKNSLPVIHEKDANGERRYPGIDVRGETQLVVGVGSYHKNGGRYRWKTLPTHPVADFPAFLLEGADDEELDIRPHGMSPWAWRALRSECEKVRRSNDGERNTTLWRASCRVGEVVAGGSLNSDVAAGYLVRAGTAVGLDEVECESVVERGFEAGENNPRRGRAPFTSRQEAMDFLDEVTAALHHGEWKGHRGKRMRAVMEAMLAIARRAGGPGDFGASHLLIATEAGMGLDAVRHGIEDGIDEGWIVRRLRGYPTHPSRWSLRIPTAYAKDSQESVGIRAIGGGDDPDVAFSPPRAHQCPTVMPVDGTLKPQRLNINHDAFWGRFTDNPVNLFMDHDLVAVFYRYGLGKTAWLLYEQLRWNGSPMTTSDLMQQTGVSRATIWRTMTKKLMPFSLVEKDEQGAYRALPVSEDLLESVAATLGVDGAGALQGARYEAMRPETEAAEGSQDAEGEQTAITVVTRLRTRIVGIAPTSSAA